MLRKFWRFLHVVRFMRLRFIFFAFLVANFCLADPTDDLSKAIENMDPEAVLDACSAGAEVNAKNQYQCSPIYAAVMNYARMRQENLAAPNIEDMMERLNLVIQYLLALGADPQGTNGHGFTAIGIARGAQLPYLVQMLETAQGQPAQTTAREMPFLRTQTPAPSAAGAIISEEEDLPVIHAAPTEHRTLAIDEPDPPPTPSRLHMLFQEHTLPVPRGADEDGFSPISLNDSDEELVGQPGRLPTPSERIRATLRGIPLVGVLFAMVSRLSTDSGQH